MKNQMDFRPGDWLRAAVLIGLGLTAGCGGSSDSGAGGAGGNGGAGEKKIRVTATVGMVAYTAERVGGSHVEVSALMGPGVDPHLYKASEGDIRKLSDADIIFYSGLNLEGKMGEVLKKIGAAGKPVVAVSEQGVDPSLLRSPPEFQGHHDPHIWFDVSLWAKTILPAAEALAKLAPQWADEFRANAAAYEKELAALHEDCKTQLATIPKAQRVLITAHDAFGYFGRAYDVQVEGLQGVSTSSEYGLRDIQRLVELIVQRKVKAVFVESSVPRRSIEAVVEGCKARGHQVVIGGSLFSDAMGEPGTPDGTYPGMVRKNLQIIVGALK